MDGMKCSFKFESQIHISKLHVFLVDLLHWLSAAQIEVINIAYLACWFMRSSMKRNNQMVFIINENWIRYYYFYYFRVKHTILLLIKFRKSKSLSDQF